MPVAGISESQAPAPRLAAEGQERAAALAEARQRAGAAAQAATEADGARQEELFAASREALARAVGANTRLSIVKSDDAGVFIFRAIDSETGEVVFEWPPEQFLAFAASLGIDGGAVAKGLVVDDRA